MKYKNNHANCLHNLNRLKQNLLHALKRADDIRREMETKNASLAKKEKDVGATSLAIEAAKRMERKQQAMQTQLKNMPDPLKFVKQKKECEKERRDNKDWQRKIEIA